MSMPPLFPSQQAIYDHPARFKVAFCGRRYGKTEIGVQRILKASMQQTGIYWWVGLSWKSASMKRAWRLLKKRTRHFAVIREAEKEIHFPDETQIWLRTAENPESLSGEGVRGLVFDEFSMAGEVVWTEHLRATLADYQGWALFLGVPKGLNWATHLYYRGQDESNLEWQSWQCPTSDNPYIKKEEVEAAKADLPEDLYKQEYLAEIIRGAGAVFRNINANMIAKPTDPKEHKGHRVVAGVDWAQKQDFTAISVGCMTCMTELELDRFNKIEWAFQRGRLHTLCTKWGVSDILAEENSIGSPNIEALQRDGLPVRGFQTTASSKPPLIQSLALSLEKVEFKFLPNKIASVELEAYESKVNTNTGRASYSAPDGMHDDTVIARALMREAAQGGHVLDFT